MCLQLRDLSNTCYFGTSSKALEFPSMCEGASSLEESSVLSEEERGMLIWQ